MIEEILKAKVRFGLVQQGHIKTIEDMLDKNMPWSEINQAIGWAGSAANDSYIRHLRKAITDEEVKNLSLSKKIGEINREILDLNEELAEISL